MKIHAEFLVAKCGVSFYAIGFLVAGVKGLRKRKGLRKHKKLQQSVFKMAQLAVEIYSVAVLTCIDFVADLTITIRWLEKSNTRNIGMVSASVLLAQRVISALVLGEEDGWRTGVRQFFDFEVFKRLMQSVEYNRPIYGLKKYKILEGLLESFPQLLLQTYFVVKREEIEQTKLLMLHVSITTSLLSLAMCYLFSDIVGIEEGGCDCHEEGGDIHPNEHKTNWKKKIKLGCSYGCLCVWRFGEVATRITVLVAFANVVSAKVGSLCISGGLLAFYLILMKKFPESYKATMFYRKSEPKGLIKRGEMDGGQEDLEENKTSEPIGGMTMSRKISRLDRKLLPIPEGNFVQQESTFGKIKKVVIKVINDLGGAVFAVLALPSLSPTNFVLAYYLFKFIFEGGLIVLCLWWTEGIDTATNVLDLAHILEDEVFEDIWWYWAIGVFCFVLGGALSSRLINTTHWENVLKGDEKPLLQLMENKHSSFVERVVGNGVFTVNDMTKRALTKMNLDLSNKDEISDQIKSFEDIEPYCKLFRCMLRQRIIRLGPKRKILRKEAIKSQKYDNYVVPALLRRCNENRSTSKECELAKYVLTDILKYDQTSVNNFTYKDIRNAGASLSFLRFHLKADKRLFEKEGDFKCTAQELFKEHFDLLFCLQCKFSHKELIEAGFKKVYVEDEVFTNPDTCTIEELIKFKSKLFEMQFTAKQLLNHVEAGVVLDWHTQTPAGRISHSNNMTSLSSETSRASMVSCRHSTSRDAALTRSVTYFPKSSVRNLKRNLPEHKETDEKDEMFIGELELIKKLY